MTPPWPPAPPAPPDGVEDALRGWPDPVAADGLTRSDPGYDTAWWRDALRRGWLRRAFPARVGGSGDFSGLVAFAERLGAAAFPAPLLGSVLSGFALLGADAEPRPSHGEHPEHPEHAEHLDHLELLLSGARTYALCLVEADGDYSPAAVTTRAAPRPGGDWVIDGAKCFVPYAASADTLLVLARTAERGHTLFAVDAGLPGLALRALPTLGGDRQCEVRLDGVRVPDAAVIGTPHAAWDAVRPAAERALVVQCADMTGASDAAMRYAVEHVKARRQWGVPLGTFQAVQHRCADMLTDVVLCREAVYEAAAEVDAMAEIRPLTATSSALKALCAPRCRHVSASAHQLGGGAGIHADVPLHLWYRRIKAAEPTLGSPRFHRARVAEALLAAR